MDEVKERKILKEAQDRLKKVIENDSENRRIAKEDLEFAYVPGSQWPSNIKAERVSTGRPCLEINKMPVFIDQVVGDQRMNRPSIKVIPVDDQADYRVAEILSGWIKHVQQISKSDVAIDHAFEHAAACGYGALRVVTKYTSDSSFEQEAFIEKIDNALAVYWGVCSEYDCSDAKYCFVVSDIDRDEYRATYKSEPMSFNYTDSQYVEGWSTKDQVRLVEYFVKEPVTKTLYLLSDRRTVNEIREGDVVVRERTVKSYDIKWYLLSGNKVLDERVWVGKKYIPIIPVWGKEINVAGKRYIRGLIRFGKDPQRMYNYWSALSLAVLLPTPFGWLKMKDVQIGHKLFDDKGQVCTVIDVSPIFENRECKEVLFDDGSVITADIEHLWTVEERVMKNSVDYSWETKTITTGQLVPDKHFIYMTAPLELPEQEFSIPPYVLGVWLGDGKSKAPHITLHKSDAEEMFFYLQFFGCELGDYTNYGESCVGRTILNISKKFSALNLLKNKHIPYQYVRGSIKQRLELLQGLMDTDGSVDAMGRCSFATTESEIAKGFAELLRTLGIKAKFRVVDNRGKVSFVEDKRVESKKALYVFTFTAYSDMPVFRLSRKATRVRKGEVVLRRTKRYGILSITPVPSVPVKCITVDSPSALYLAGSGMIPTHNSADTESVALQPKIPYFVTPAQISGHEAMWNSLDKQNYQYLLVNFDEKAPGWPQRQLPPQASSAMVQKINMADQEIRDTIGLQRASLGMPSNERSGIAIRERKKEGDVGTFAFSDNLARSVEYIGRVLVDIAPFLLDTERIIRLGLVNGEHEFEAVNVQTDEGTILNDLSVGTYDVAVTVGPSFTTQRTEARQSMQEFIQYYPNAAPLIGDLYAKVMDWPGAEEVSQRLEFLLPPEIKAKKAAEIAKRTGQSVPPPAEEPAPPPPNPIELVKLEEEKMKLEDLKVKLQQEQVKLLDLQVKLEQSTQLTNKPNIPSEEVETEEL